jgi:Protein of unknown function (DUF1549)/Protein of unknown function (DUF1553)/Planctomycete cytochrome C/Concanavalin A-like lectin/glucanases superfamily
MKAIAPRAKTGCAVVVVGLATVLQACSSEVAGVAEEVDYDWHVRPILSENCFKCHGPEPKSREAGLRLDIRDAATAELPETPGRHAIVPGAADESELMRRITAEDTEVRMPPQSEHKTLTDEQIETLRVWIDAGAEYKRHWAFIPPERPNLPQTAFEGRVENDIDRFIFARLEREALEPSAPADRMTLINRVSLTLTGLPPTLAEVDAFVADESPDAYAQLVDRLLDSPRYAEHMAGYWMDLARFSETDGYLDDHHDRMLWPWRDWVIGAFDENMPFNQFGTWQLAGDLLPDATDEQILATAFLRVGQRTTENGAIDDEYKVEYMVDRTNNALGTAFLGLTVGCARCHDHKYDPISQKDFYSLGAFFNSIDEPGVYAAGRSQIQGGPTLPWVDAEAAEKVAAAADSVAVREAGYVQAREAARTAAAAKTTQGLADVDGLEDAMQAAIQDGLAAHYSFDEATPVAVEDLPPPRPRMRPPGIATATGTPPRAPAAPPAGAVPPTAAAQFGAMFAVQRNYIADQLTLSNATTANVPPAVIQAPELRPGVKGTALFFTPTNKGFLGRDVGWYERTQSFSLDFWFFAADTYDKVPVLNHKSEQDSARSGYMLEIADGDLLVRFAHSPPANMIELRTAEPFPVGKWTHVTLTYDGSSRAAGVKLYLDGKSAETAGERDQLTRTMLPWDLASFFDPFVGMSFGTRFREKAPVGSGLDEVRVFDDELTPVEVAYLHDPSSVLNAPATWTTALEDLFVATDAGVVAARAALMEARELHNQLVSFLPQVLVMTEAPQPHPTYVLERGVYSAPAEQVSPKGLESVFTWDPELPENRLGLATWLFDQQNPLTARVFVNRIWQQHFGRGLVETAEDFGAQGSLPTHAELLDWLATEFVESGWDVKNLHRLIVSSATYRQSAVVSDAPTERRTSCWSPILSGHLSMLNDPTGSVTVREANRRRRLSVISKRGHHRTLTVLQGPIDP